MLSLSHQLPNLPLSQHLHSMLPQLLPQYNVQLHPMFQLPQLMLNMFISNCMLVLCDRVLSQ